MVVFQIKHIWFYCSRGNYAKSQAENGKKFKKLQEYDKSHFLKDAFINNKPNNSRMFLSLFNLLFLLNDGGKAVIPTESVV